MDSYKNRDSGYALGECAKPSVDISFNQLSTTTIESSRFPCPIIKRFETTTSVSFVNDHLKLFLLKTWQLFSIESEKRRGRIVIYGCIYVSNIILFNISIKWISIPVEPQTARWSITSWLMELLVYKRPTGRWKSTVFSPKSLKPFQPSTWRSASSSLLLPASLPWYTFLKIMSYYLLHIRN